MTRLTAGHHSVVLCFSVARKQRELLEAELLCDALLWSVFCEGRRSKERSATGLRTRGFQ